MNRHALTRRLRLILIGTALCGLLFYLWMLPYFIQQRYPDDPASMWLCLALLWLSALPCYAVLIDGWRIARRIGNDRSFTEENARSLRRISTLAACDAGYIALINPILLICGAWDVMFLMLSVIVIFIGIAVSVAAAALSHLVLRAAELQEQSDLTI